MCVYCVFVFSMLRRPPRSTLFPYTNALPILALLTPQERAAFLMRHYEGCSIEEICRALRLRENAAKHSIFRDRKSTRLNSSHVEISYAVFCLKKKKKNE